MQIEVQIKTRVSNFMGVKRKIEKIARFIDEEDKVDYYFKGKFRFDRTELRLRKKGNKKEITHKINYFKDGVEKNEEYGFSISNASNFIKMLDDLGVSVAAMKHKKSFFYKYKGIKIQLVSIKELGYFLEIEKKLDEGDKSKAENDILKFAEELGIKKNMIEKRSYFELLMKKKESEQGAKSK